MINTRREGPTTRTRRQETAKKLEYYGEQEKEAETPRIQNSQFTTLRNLNDAKFIDHLVRYSSSSNFFFSSFHVLLNVKKNEQ